jgi:death on curing protein
VSSKRLSVELVELIHSEVLYDHEIAGRAIDKSLEGALARVDTRLAYGLIDDVFSLTACYATVISQGHYFNDANKRTAFVAMDTVLHINGIEVFWDTEEVGQKMIALAQSHLDEELFAEWLRQLANAH